MIVLMFISLSLCAVRFLGFMSEEQSWAIRGNYYSLDLGFYTLCNFNLYVFMFSPINLNKKRKKLRLFRSGGLVI